MTLETVFLDETPLSLITMRHGKSSEADACHEWLIRLLRAGIQVYVAEITDYEVRRKLVRAKKAMGLRRLDQFLMAEEDRLVPLTRTSMLKASALWAEARNKGIPTADRHSLDGDVILAAQVLTAGFSPSRVMVATENIKHLSRYVPCADWRDIQL